MQPKRFLRNLIFDRNRAAKTIRLVARSLYGMGYWRLRPHAPLNYRIGDKVIRLDPQHVFTHFYWPGTEQYEPEVQAFFRRFLREGDVFVDCGSNVGLFTVIASSLVGKTGQVAAIEANPETFTFLSENMRLNNITSFCNYAITSGQGTVELFSPG